MAEKVSLVVLVDCEFHSLHVYGGIIKALYFSIQRSANVFGGEIVFQLRSDGLIRPDFRRSRSNVYDSEDS